MAREIWGDFEVDFSRRLGSGGMGALHRARQISVGRTVAFKILSRDLSEDEAFARQFEREAQLSGGLQHEHIVAVYAAGEHRGQRYIAFELVSGVNLALYLARRRQLGRPLSDGEAAGLCIQLASGLAAAHQIGVIHRDIKPSNLLLTPVDAGRLSSAALGVRLSGQSLKISDFGIASTGLTHRSQLGDFASPGYTAPERFDGAVGDARADIYSAGIVLYELLAGAPPFSGTLAEVMARQVLGRPPELPGEHHPELLAIIERCLAKAPADRFPSAEALLLRLIDLGAELESPDDSDFGAETAAPIGLGAVEEPSAIFEGPIDFEADPEDDSSVITEDKLLAVRASESSTDGATEALAGDSSPPRVLVDSETAPVPSGPEAVARRLAVDTRTEPLELEESPAKEEALTADPDASGQIKSLRMLRLPGPEARRIPCGADHELFPDRPLGEGGMGTVYLGRQVSLDRAVAIKVLKLEASDNTDDDLRERFRRESRLAARLQHPNVVSVLAAGVIEEPGDFAGLPYYAMELVLGEDLKAYLSRRGRLSIEESLQLIEQAAAGLCAAAELNLVHRDIKPGNLILTRDAGRWRVKIADFGLVKDMNAGSVTQRGTVLGSIAYIAPEQLEGRVDPRADLYALGVTWYQILTGELPFQEPTVSAMLKAHREKTPPRVSGVPEAVADAVARCLAKRPEERFRSARAFLDHLRELRAVTDSSIRKADAGRPLELEPTERFAVVLPRTSTLGPSLLLFVLLSGLIAGAFRWAHQRAVERDRAAIVAQLTLGRLAPAERDLRRARRRYGRGAGLWPLERWCELAQTAVESAAALEAGEATPRARLEALLSAVDLAPKAASELRARLQATIPEPALRSLEELEASFRELAGRLRARLAETAIPPGMRRVEGQPHFEFGMKTIPIEDFALDVHEVTYGEYREFLAAVKKEGDARWRHPDQPSGKAGHEPETWGLPDLLRDELPVVGIDWYDAYAYARFRGKRLPRQAEWEYAACPATQPFPWGHEFKADNLRWIGGPASVPPGVGALPPGSVPADRGPYGHYDLLGNVREWTADWYQDPDGRTESRGFARVIRGFSWAVGDEDTILVYARGRAKPETRMIDLGFRCALDLNGPRDAPGSGK